MRDSSTRDCGNKFQDYDTDNYNEWSGEEETQPLAKRRSRRGGGNTQNRHETQWESNNAEQ